MKYPIRSLIETAGWIKKVCARIKCKRDFWVIPSKQELIFCCKECRHQPWEKRLWENVVKGAQEGDCWTFKLAPNAEGYPYLKKDGKEERVARLMWELHNGPIPDGHVIRHTCDNTKCINPAHLISGTQADNMKDRNERDRTAKGEAHGNSELTVEQVKKIKSLKGSDTLQKIADQFNVSIHTIWSIWNGRTWKDV